MLLIPFQDQDNQFRGGTVVSKSTRIVELVHMLSGRRSRTVAEIAEKLEVSERTIYRDIRDLSIPDDAEVFLLPRIQGG